MDPVYRSCKMTLVLCVESHFFVDLTMALLLHELTLFQYIFAATLSYTEPDVSFFR